MDKITVFIVEDHQMVREMWVQLFAVRKDIDVIGETGNPEEAIEMIKNKRPEIVLLDINLPGSSGMDLVPLIRKFAPGSKIIAVSMHNQPAYTKKMLQLGALGYVTKNSSHEEIYKAIDSAMKGKTYVCQEIRNILSDLALQDEPAGPDVKELSIREIEIIRLIKEGLSSKEIAARLNISIRTAEVHRHNILKKLGLKNTASLISFINTTDLSF
jgi:two-component system, NarL family, invasion response regulator UvrY